MLSRLSSRRWSSGIGSLPPGKVDLGLGLALLSTGVSSSPFSVICFRLANRAANSSAGVGGVIVVKSVAIAFRARACGSVAPLACDASGSLLSQWGRNSGVTSREGLLTLGRGIGMWFSLGGTF